MTDRDPNALLWDFLRGAMCTKALGIVVDLGVADALADGPRPVDELAQENGATTGTLHRVLRALASDGIFVEEKPGVFRNTETSELLRRDRATGWPEFAHLFGGVFYDAVGTLDPGTDEGTFHGAFGADFWSWLGHHPKERAIFDAAMGAERADDRLVNLDWRGDEVVVDVGGGNGALLKGLIERRPGLRGVILELPETERDESTFGERITFVPGSFFDEVPAGDVYVLGRILHDWDDKRAGAILRTIRATAPQDGRLLALESVISPGNEPQGSKWLDLLMLVLAGGRERTEPEWHDLLEGAGFRIEQIEDGLIQARCL